MSYLNSIRSLLVLITINILLNSIVCNENVVSVRLSRGVINGKIESLVANRNVNVFRGIPFAEPPIGHLRFKKPQPLKQWPQSMDAFDWPNPCPQGKAFSMLYEEYYNKNFSEDCLYLNIWSPEDSLESGKLKPVLFYIHGGALAMGTSSWKNTNMGILATKGDVVTVSINYRLNTLGFLYTGTEDAPGNVGLWDQALALEWVNDNIRYFGGDDKDITIMGASAGGMSVSLHVLSPISRNLFQKAFLQSGAYVNHMVDGEYKNHIEMWLKGSQLIGCNDQKVTDRFTPEIIECLRQSDLDKLVGIREMPEMATVTGSFMPMVAVDGEFLPRMPTEMLESGDFKQDVTMMVSTAVDEGGFLLAMFNQLDITNPVEFVMNNITYAEAYDKLSKIASKVSNKYQVNGAQVAKLYFTGLSETTDSNTLKRTIGIAIGDYILGCPPLLFAKEVFRRSNFQTNIYQYYWNRKTKLNHDPFGAVDFFGPYHGGDVYSLYGLPFLDPDNFPDEERDFSEQMMKMLTDFVKTGSPSSPTSSATVWPKYYAIDDHIIAPFYEFTQTPKSDTNFGVGLKITECEYLWRKYLV